MSSSNTTDGDFYSTPAGGSGFTDGNSNFAFKFTLPNDVVKTSNGKFSPTVPTWKVSIAKVEYTSEADLSGRYKVDDNATAGPTSLNIPFSNDSANKIVITGNVAPPIHKAYAVTGSGDWSSS